MFFVVYHFEVIPGKDSIFIENWERLTRLIYEYEGSHGSRLHKAENNLYIGYACWPSKAIWENSGNALPESATSIREKMKESCIKISTMNAMSLVSDLIRPGTHQ